MNFRIKKVKELSFKRSDGEIIDLEIPQELNQSLLRSMISSEYVVTKMVVGREVRESEIVTLKSGGVVGYLVPGQAILSKDHPMNGNPFFGTYSLIAAMKVCSDSFDNEYQLVGASGATATSNFGVFEEGVFYAVIWLKKLGVSAKDFAKKYFVSLAKSGVFISVRSDQPIPSSRTQESYEREIRLVRNSDWPDYIRVIVTELSPYAADPFLRFFYMYQVVETLMAVNYKGKLEEIKARFVGQADISITQLKDYMKEFQGITKEDARIKMAMYPPCPDSELFLNALLAKLNESHSDMEFGERVYKIRNIMFHDYQRILSFGADISAIEDCLMNYILDKKLS